MEVHVHAMSSRPGEIELSIIHERGDVGLRLSREEAKQLLRDLQVELNRSVGVRSAEAAA